MSEMEQARIKSTNLDYLNKLTKLDLLVIDDFGLMDLDLDKCRLDAAFTHADRFNLGTE